MFSVSLGWCRTSLGRTARVRWYQWPGLALLMLVFGNSVQQGADSIVFCAAAPPHQLHNYRGKFIKNRQVEENIEHILDQNISQRQTLWTRTEELFETLQLN